MNTAPIVWHQGLEWLGVLIGARYYFSLKKRGDSGGMLAAKNFPVIVGCLAGAGIGNKAAYWFQVPHIFAEHWRDPLLIALGGQSIVGGLVGGLIGVEIAKKLMGIRESTGDFFVFPLLLGTMIGRIGCFIAGLNDDTYGNATTLPWGHDFGDGIMRHPTPLYEIAYCAMLWVVLLSLRPSLNSQPGLLFKIYLSSYLVWRLFVDFLKPVPYSYVAGLSGIQVICAIALIAYLPLVVRQFRTLRLPAEVVR